MNTALIIDDEPEYRKVLTELLKHDGWKVFEAEEGVPRHLRFVCEDCFRETGDAG